MEKNKPSIYLLAGLAITLLLLGKFIHVFPFFMFLGLTPLFLLFSLYQKNPIAGFPVFLTIFISLLVTFLGWNLTYSNETAIDWLLPVIYSIAICLAFIVYRFTDKHARNRIGFFTIPIYWLAVEYLMLQVSPIFSRFALAATFGNNPTLITWNVYTGYLGVSLWILLINILFYYVLFNSDRILSQKISWVKLAFTMIIACGPVLLGVEAEPIQRHDLLAEGAITAKQVAGSGEYIGKTAVWVAILLMLYSFVKREVKDD